MFDHYIVRKLREDLYRMDDEDDSIPPDEAERLGICPACAKPWTGGAECPACAEI